ncbi:MAG TPA: SprT family zinc-dependent metalloprotease [Bacteroidales bacterium]
MSEQVYYFKSIGDVVFVKNNRAKSLRITVRPNKGVKVTVPKHVSLTNAFRFVEEKSGWIKKSLEKVRAVEKNSTLFKPGFEFSTRYHKLEFIFQPDCQLTARVGNGLIRIFYSTEDKLLGTTGQDFIRKAVDYALRKEAKMFLPQRVEYLADKFGFKYSGLRIKNLKSRWGSCSVTNNINLNIHLMRLPDYLIDYVILHELTHTVHKNHGKQFWQTLDTVSGNARLFAKEMKGYRTQVY